MGRLGRGGALAAVRARQTLKRGPSAEVDGQGHLAHREGVRQESWHRQAGATRSSEKLCPAVPYGGRQIGTDSVSVGPGIGEVAFAQPSPDSGWRQNVLRQAFLKPPVLPLHG